MLNTQKCIFTMIMGTLVMQMVSIVSTSSPAMILRNAVLGAVAKTAQTVICH